MDGDPDRVPDPPGVDPHVLRVGQVGQVEIEGQHVGPVKLDGVAVGVVDVRVGPDRHVERLSVGREGRITRPVAAPPQATAPREVGNDGLRSPARLDVPLLIGEANDGVGVADVEPVGVVSWRIERQAEGLVQSRGEPFGHHRASVGADAAEHPHFASGALGHEEIAVWRRPDEPRVREPTGIEIDPEARGGLGPGLARPSYDLWPVVGRPRRAGRGQISNGDPVRGAGVLEPVVEKGERGFGRPGHRAPADDRGPDPDGDEGRAEADRVDGARR